MTDTPTDVAVILVNWNGWRDTKECILSLQKSTIPIIIIVVDNSSSDNSVAELTAHFGNSIVLLANQSNLGFGGGCNVGLKWALDKTDCHWFWLLNNDTTVLPDSAAKLVDAAVKHPEWGITGNVHADYHSPEILQVVGGGWFNPWTTGSGTYGAGCHVSQSAEFNPAEMRLNQISGASFLLSRQVVNKVGFLNERLFLFFEEIDYANRVRRAGYKLGVATDSLIYHKQGASTGACKQRGTRTLLVDFYGIRNRILITRIYFPIALPVIYTTLLFSFAKRLLTGRFRAALQVLLIIFGILKQPLPEKRSHLK